MEGCKPNRVLNKIRRFHVEMPDRVSEAHVKAYESWLAAQDAADEVYDFLCVAGGRCPRAAQ